MACFPVQFEFWFIIVPFLPDFVATKPNKIFDYLYLNKERVVESDRISVGIEWPGQ
jgi:hypothetical protein